MLAEIVNLREAQNKAPLLHHVAMELELPDAGDQFLRRQVAREISQVKGVSSAWYSRLVDDVIVVEHDPASISAVSLYEAVRGICPVRRKVLF